MPRKKWLQWPVALALVSLAWGLAGCRKDASPRLSQDPRYKDLNPLMRAALDGDLATVDSLLRAGANVNAPTHSGGTALHYAAYGGHAQVVKALLQAGADVNAHGSDGFTPLHSSAHCGNVEVVKLLLAAHADVNARVEGDETPLLRSIDMAFGKPEITLAMIEAGADVNAVEDTGDTPLMIALNESSYEVVETLLKKGADPNHLVRGMRPIDLMSGDTDGSRRKLLLRYGAGPDSKPSFVN